MNRSRDVVAAIAGLAAAVVISATTGITWWLNAILAGLLLLLPAVRVPAASALIGLHVHSLGTLIAHNSAAVPEWDFRVFWLHAQLAARGFDFYDRTVVREFLTTVHATPRFIELGRFWNPPQTMLLYIPLGFTSDIRSAYLWWSAVQILALGGCAVLLTRDAGDWRARAAIVALLVAMYPTYVTFVVAQTNFLLLFLLLSAWTFRRSFAGGVFLALAATVKPIALILLIDTLIRRRGKMAAGFAGMAAGLTVISLATFGSAVNASYYLHGAGAVPRELLTQIVNRSLLAVFLRAGLSPVMFAFAALAIVTVAAWIVWKNELLGLAALIASALLIYPQTLDHYGVLLIIPIVVLSRIGVWTAGAAWLVHSLAAPVPRVFDQPNLALASVVILGVLWILCRSHFAVSTHPEPVAFSVDDANAAHSESLRPL